MTKSEPVIRRPRTAFVWLFAIVVVAVYFFGLTIPLVGPDEPRYAQVAREMYERTDWITPTLSGFNWFEKPALLYWLEIASYRLFGVNEFAARFGSALFGLGTVASLWILGRSLATEHSESNSASRPEDSVSSAADGFANWLALIAATSIGLIVFSRGASFDIILTFPMTTAMVAFYIFDAWEHRIKPHATAGGTNTSSIALLVFYFFVGVSLLAKGLVGIVFPYAIVAFYYVLSWRFPSRKVILSLFWGTLLAAAVASVWYLPMYSRHGWTFIDEFIIQHHFQRFTSNKYFHPQPFYFFFWVLPLMTLPWLPFLVGGLWNFVRGVFKRRDAETQSNISTFPLLLFSFSWLLVPLVFFSFSGSKLPGYILPALPPALIFAADSVYRFAEKSWLRSRAMVGIALTTLIGIVIALVTFVPQFARDDSTKDLIAAASERAFAEAKVLSMHHASHNAEFYAAGRLLRDQEGKQKIFFGPAEILEEIRHENGTTVLVLVPIEYIKQLTETDYLESTVLAQNPETAIVAVAEAKPVNSQPPVSTGPSMPHRFLSPRPFRSR
jgi:4-amino-4-deoxy-L-arabinose transferase-like glycosyltransferase